jgi:hypothetical protein
MCIAEADKPFDACLWVLSERIWGYAETSTGDQAAWFV